MDGSNIFILFACIVSFASGFERTQNFYIDWENDRFMKDGLPFQYVAGGMHYFRVPHQYWGHRISAAKSAGLNAIQSYVAWNMHEPEKGQYNFQGRMDIVGFIKEVHKHEMALILRVGPYICGARDFGGLPDWLLAVPGMKVRTTHLEFMRAVEEWLGVLLREIEPYLYNNGGPIIMIQIENEYGAFGCDSDYLTQLYDMFHNRLGNEVVYFTLDGPGDYTCGSFNSTKVLTTIDYLEDNDKGLHTEEYFTALREFQPRGPLVNTEYYTGWLDQWGSHHDNRAADTLHTGLKKLISLNASVALFVWHGGSNFGIDSGAYTTTTSYDYDAPMSEAGDIKLDKYWAVRKAVEEFYPGNTLPVPLPVPKLSGKTLNMSLVGQLVSLVNRDNFILYNRHPLKMEEMGIFDTMIAYQHSLSEPLENVQLIVEGVHDRAYVLADNNFVKVLRREEEGSFTVSANFTITVLLESLGHIAWLSGGLDSMDNEYKGIGNVTVNGEIVEKWAHYKLDTKKLTQSVGRVDGGCHGYKTLHSGYHGYKTLHNSHDLLLFGPSVFRGEVYLEGSELLDTFLDTTGWSKGFLLVNGQTLGRYWPEAGPQYTLYIPGVFLKTGSNVVEMVEMQQASHSMTVSLTDRHVIDGVTNSDVI